MESKFEKGWTRHVKNKKRLTRESMLHALEVLTYFEAGNLPGAATTARARLFQTVTAHDLAREFFSMLQSSLHFQRLAINYKELTETGLQKVYDDLYTMDSKSYTMLASRCVSALYQSAVSFCERSLLSFMETKVNCFQSDVVASLRPNITACGGKPAVDVCGGNRLIQDFSTLWDRFLPIDAEDNCCSQMESKPGVEFWRAALTNKRTFVDAPQKYFDILASTFPHLIDACSPAIAGNIAQTITQRMNQQKLTPKSFNEILLPSLYAAGLLTCNSELEDLVVDQLASFDGRTVDAVQQLLFWVEIKNKDLCQPTTSWEDIINKNFKEIQKLPNSGDHDAQKSKARDEELAKREAEEAARRTAKEKIKPAVIPSRSGELRKSAAARASAAREAKQAAERAAKAEAARLEKEMRAKEAREEQARREREEAERRRKEEEEERARKKKEELERKRREKEEADRLAEEARLAAAKAERDAEERRRSHEAAQRIAEEKDKQKKRDMEEAERERQAKLKAEEEERQRAANAAAAAVVAAAAAEAAAAEERRRKEERDAARRRAEAEEEAARLRLEQKAESERLRLEAEEAAKREKTEALAREKARKQEEEEEARCLKEERERALKLKVQRERQKRADEKRLLEELQRSDSSLTRRSSGEKEKCQQLKRSKTSIYRGSKQQRKANDDDDSSCASITSRTSMKRKEQGEECHIPKLLVELVTGDKTRDKSNCACGYYLCGSTEGGSRHCAMREDANLVASACYAENLCRPDPPCTPCPAPPPCSPCPPTDRPHSTPPTTTGQLAAAGDMPSKTNCKIGGSHDAAAKYKGVGKYGLTFKSTDYKRPPVRPAVPRQFVKPRIAGCDNTDDSCFYSAAPMSQTQLPISSLRKSNKAASRRSARVSFHGSAETSERSCTESATVSDCSPEHSVSLEITITR